jgi:hypothetical protein
MRRLFRFLQRLFFKSAVWFLWLWMAAVVYTGKTPGSGINLTNTEAVNAQVNAMLTRTVTDEDIAEARGIIANVSPNMREAFGSGTPLIIWLFNANCRGCADQAAMLRSYTYYGGLPVVAFATDTNINDSAKVVAQWRLKNAVSLYHLPRFKFGGLRSRMQAGGCIVTGNIPSFYLMGTGGKCLAAHEGLISNARLQSWKSSAR